MSKRVLFIEADFDGASYQTFPETDKPWKVRGVIETDKSKRNITILMNREEAEDLLRQLGSLLGIGGEQ